MAESVRPTVKEFNIDDDVTDRHVAFSDSMTTAQYISISR